MLQNEAISPGEFDFISVFKTWFVFCYFWTTFGFTLTRFETVSQVSRFACPGTCSSISDNHVRLRSGLDPDDTQRLSFVR